MTITSEMLRKFAEAGGFETRKSPLGDYFQYRERNKGRWMSTYAFQSQLSACFEVLERVCGERDLIYDLSVIKAHAGECKIGTRHFNLMLAAIDVDVCGETKNEAIILAVLAAKEQS